MTEAMTLDAVDTLFTHECQDCGQYLVVWTALATNVQGEAYCLAREGEFHRPVALVSPPG